MRALVAGVALLLAAAPAAAAKRSSGGAATAASRKVQEREARKACLNGDPNKGVAILSDLFVDTRIPTYIYNQARCFEQNGRYRDAVIRFEEYLRTADPKTYQEARADAEKHLADCKARVAQERGASGLEPVPQPLVQPAPTLAPEPVPDPSLSPHLATPTVVQATPSPARSRRLLTAGIITGAVGVVAVAGGVVLALKANRMVDEMEHQIGGYSADKENDEKTYKTLAYVGYGVGAACVATGAVLIGLGIKARVKTNAGSTAEIALVPAVSHDRLGAMLTGAF